MCVSIYYGFWLDGIENFARAYAQANNKGKLITETLWDLYGDYFSDRDEWGTNVAGSFRRDLPKTIGYDPYLTYLVDDLGLGA